MIESQVELKMQVASKSHFGGDGFGLWLLHESMNPASHTETDWLSGPIVGLRANFEGVGIIFDTYDNDNQRDNPSVFVIKNFPRDGQPPSDFVV